MKLYSNPLIVPFCMFRYVTAYSKHYPINAMCLLK